MNIDFDPTPVRTRRRRVDIPLVALMVVVLGVGVAVVKPWAVTGDPSLSPPPVAAATPSPAAPTAAPGTRPPTWSDVASVVASHDEWGVQTISRRKTPPWSSDTAIYLEDWTPAAADGSGTRSAIVDPAFGPIVLLGATVPTEVRPDAVLIWRIVDDHAEWVDADPIWRGDRGGSLLFIRPGGTDGPYEPWTAGRYRIEVLVDDTIRRIDVQVPGRA